MLSINRRLILKRPIIIIVVIIIITIIISYKCRKTDIVMTSSFRKYSKIVRTTRKQIETQIEELQMGERTESYYTLKSDINDMNLDSVLSPSICVSFCFLVQQSSLSTWIEILNI